MKKIFIRSFLALFISLYNIHLAYADYFISDRMTRGFFGTLFILIMFFAIKAIVGIFKVGTTAIKKSIEEKKPKTQCPKCHKIFFIETHHIGKEFTCDNCWTTFSIKELIILKSASSYNTKLENRSLNTDNIDNNYLDNTSIEDIELNAEKIEDLFSSSTVPTGKNKIIKINVILYSTTRQELESLLGTPDLVFTIQGNEITIIGYRDRPNRLFDISIKSSQSDYFARIKDTKFNIMIKNEVITLVYKV